MPKLEELEVQKGQDASFNNTYNLIICIIAACPKVKRLSIDFMNYQNQDPLIEIPKEFGVLTNLKSLDIKNM